MCVNKYYIVNPYTKRGLYVNCGKCPACQQEKAIHRVRRIKDTYSDGLECAMLTLTYSRSTAPYIDRSEAYNFSRGRLPYLNVYRDSSYRKIRKGSSYEFEYRKIPAKVTIGNVPFSRECNFDKLKDLKYERGKIGVCFYKDLQNFMARLRLNLKRKYNYYETFKTFSCSEYGSKSNRPHFHLLFFYRKGDFETLRSAIFESWAFSDLSHFDRAFERCFRGASYVASYVNLGVRFSDFLKTYFRPKHSYSKGFGLGNSFYSLQSILNAFNQNSLTYPCVKTDKVQTVAYDRLLPKYVIHRYFPKFKGYTRIAPSALHDIMCGLGKGDFDAVNEKIAPLYIPFEECRKINTRLHNAFRRCNEEIPNVFGTFDLYYDFHIKIWNMFNSNLMRKQFEDNSVPLNQRYDNLDAVIAKARLNGDLLPIGFSEDDFIITDPNQFTTNIVRTQKLTADYSVNEKHRNVTNAVLSNLYEEW